MRIEKVIANIIINDLMKHMNDKKCRIDGLGLKPEDVRWLADLIHLEILSSSKVSKVIDYYIEHGGDIKTTISILDLWPKYDDGLEPLVDQVISENEKIVEQIKGGKHKAIGSLIGKLKQLDKSIDSKEAMKLLKEKLL